MDVQYLISVVYHNLEMMNERDGAVARHYSTIEKRANLEVIVVDEEVRDVWKLVTEVGAALAAR